MNSRVLITLPVLLFGLMMTANSATVSHGHGYKRFMAKFDTNGDNKVTLKEFNSTITKRFKRIDINGDGAISPEEFAKYVKIRRKEKMEQRIKEMDRNNDNVISKNEYLRFKRARAERYFAWMDRNGDGVISGREISYLQKHKRRYGRSYFYRMDTDRDGRISLAENRKAWANWFNRIDGNHDKVITENELRIAHENRWKR